MRTSNVRFRAILTRSCACYDAAWPQLAQIGSDRKPYEMWFSWEFASDHAAFVYDLSNTDFFLPYHAS